MKSWKNLFQQVINEDNIRLAMSSVEAKHVNIRNEDDYIKDLICRLETQTWRPPVHDSFLIVEGPHKKERVIIKPSYEEQVVHHAIIQVLEPVFMKGMYPYSCGSTPNRGAIYGKKYLEKFTQHNKIRYVLQLDIHHYFQSINHDILLNMLAKKIHDYKMMNLLSTLIRAEEDSPNTGIPIGFYTSQWFSNFFLQELDHYIKEELQVQCYVRYMDDMVCCGSNKRKLHDVKNKIEEYLNSIKLQLKSNWKIFKFDYVTKDNHRVGRPLDFMGFKFYSDRTTLRKSIYMRAVKKAKRMKNPNWYSSCQMLSYLGYLRSAKCHAAFVKYVKPFINIKRLKYLVSQHDKKRRKDFLWLLSIMNRIALGKSLAT